MHPHTPRARHRPRFGASQFLRFAEIFTRLSGVFGTSLPTLEYNGHIYCMNQKTMQDFWDTYDKNPHLWFMVHEHSSKHIAFILFPLNGFTRDRRSFTAWRFPIRRLQFHIRLFLARRRRARRLALAMALHPRLGAGSPMGAWLHADALGRIAEAAC